ncbi:MAG: NAD(P)H-dependent oxidoreductase [Oscillochloris sp.]|nr:NAD(P)H-dependent oxidoreductase [Oscillochloris sp.]
MHDGYIFTIGICGSANGLAPACLDIMLSALPPVKRAALLGEVLLFEGTPSLDDPLIGPIRADIADAELLVLVTPVLGNDIPTRLHTLANAMNIAPPPASPRFAVLVIIGPHNNAALSSLRHICTMAGATVIGELWVEDTGNLSIEIERLLATLARVAYTQAHSLHPEALPQ